MQELARVVEYCIADSQYFLTCLDSANSERASMEHMLVVAALARGLGVAAYDLPDTAEAGFDSVLQVGECRRPAVGLGAPVTVSRRAWRLEHPSAWETAHGWLQCCGEHGWGSSRLLSVMHVALKGAQVLSVVLVRAPVGGECLCSFVRVRDHVHASRG